MSHLAVCHPPISTHLLRPNLGPSLSFNSKNRFPEFSKELHFYEDSEVGPELTNKIGQAKF